MSRGIAIFKRTGRTGGSADKIDGIDGATGGPGSTPVQQGDIVLDFDTDGHFYPYEADADSGVAENDPDVIALDSNGGPLRFILKKIKYLGQAIAQSLTMSGVNPLTINGVAGGNTPVGAMLEWPTNTAPAGWILCDGSAVNRTTYAALFAIIGTTFGSGDGSTTFNLPDFQGRVAVGRDPSDDDFNTIGNKGGEKTHQLTVAEMPEHKHPYVDKWPAGTGDSDYENNGGRDWDYPHDEETEEVGGDLPHNNVQPYLVVNKIIKY